MCASEDADEEVAARLIGRIHWTRCTHDWRVITPGDSLTDVVLRQCLRLDVPVRIGSIAAAERTIYIAKEELYVEQGTFSTRF